MSRFSIVVPLLENPNAFENTLASVLRNRGDSTQIVVAHPEHYSDPYDLGKEVDFVPVAAETNNRKKSSVTAPTLISLFNAAMTQVRGQFVMLLRPGVQLEENWETAVADAFDDPNVGSVTAALVNNQDSSRLITAGVAATSSFNRKLIGNGQKINSRRLSKLNPLGPTSWAGVYRRSLLTALGESDITIESLYFDLELALSLSALQFDCVICPEFVVTMDEPNLLMEEAKRAHGRSAQRAVARFSQRSPGQQRSKMLTAMMGELIAAPFRSTGLAHAFQRLSAKRFSASDAHHVELLEVLQKQRQRLVAPVVPMPTQTATFRRAA